jgi:hypothetical protein
MAPNDDARDDVRWEWSHWAGTLAQLQRAARYCSNKVAELYPYPEGFTPETEGFEGTSDEYSEKYSAWSDAERARKVTVKVSERDGYSREFGNLDELDEISDGNLNSITAVSIDVNYGGYTPPGATIRVSDSGLVALLAGPDRAWTAGVRHEVEKILKPTKRLHLPLFGGDPFISAWIGAALGIELVFLASFGLFSTLSSWDKSTRVIVSVGLTVPWCGLVAVAYFSTTQFELLLPGADPKYQRWRRGVRAAVGTIVLSVIGAAIWAAVSP